MVDYALLTTSDAERWRAALPAEACVMGCLELARATERQNGAAARLLVVETAPDARIVYPFFLRPVNALRFASHSAEPLFDTFTPEYTGPLRLGRGAARTSEARHFEEALAACFRASGIVAEFAHLSPWRAELGVLQPSGVENDRDVVWLDLSLGEEGIWSRSYTSDARRMVRQAQRAGVLVRVARSREDVLAFHRLYEATMSRRDAADRYWFSADYFTSVFEAMPENARILLAEHDGHAVAGGLLFYDASDVYWYLSAADMSCARVRPVNAYVHEMIRWAIQSGKRRILCGGGHDSPDDGVFRFKASLSPLRAGFQVYKRVHDLERYSALVRARWGAPVAAAGEAYFPAYRAAGDSALREPPRASAASALSAAADP